MRRYEDTIEGRLERIEAALRARGILGDAPGAPPPPATAGDEHRRQRVEAVWSEPVPAEERAKWARYPMSHPLVSRATRLRATGTTHQDAYTRLHLWLREAGFPLPLERTASLFCGNGHLERRLVDQGTVRNCVGMDLAEGALAQARAAAQAPAYAGLRYERRDLEGEGCGPGPYQAVFCHQGLHHAERLEALLDHVAAALEPGGILHLHEFVGPDRFQWTDRQLEAINDWLASVPERYRIADNGKLITRATRPTIAEMIALDPSESVRSSAIPAVVAERFEIVERKDLGGTLAMKALARIGGNFDPADPEGAAHVERLLRMEEELMRQGEIGSDFAVILARRRTPRA